MRNDNSNSKSNSNSNNNNDNDEITISKVTKEPQRHLDAEQLLHAVGDSGAGGPGGGLHPQALGQQLAQAQRHPLLPRNVIL